jgi:hypothetical protein
MSVSYVVRVEANSQCVLKRKRMTSYSQNRFSHKIKFRKCKLT